MYHLAWYTFHTELQWSSFGRSTLRNSIRLRFSCFLFLSVARRCITALVIVGPVIWYIDLIFSGPMKYNVKVREKIRKHINNNYSRFHCLLNKWIAWIFHLHKMVFYFRLTQPLQNHTFSWHKTMSLYFNIYSDLKSIYLHVY